jgi:hypothetical protein
MKRHTSSQLGEELAALPDAAAEDAYLDAADKLAEERIGQLEDAIYGQLVQEFQTSALKVSFGVHHMERVIMVEYVGTDKVPTQKFRVKVETTD